jgi:anti-sigma-K factor RskA
MTMIKNKMSEREEIEALLPWHAAGTLSRRDAQKVEQALASDTDLATQYSLIRDELVETIGLNESLGAPSARAMQKLMADIEADASTARRTRSSFNLGEWLSEKLSSFSPRTLAWSASAAALAIVLQAGLLAGMFVNERQGDAGFKTASVERNLAVKPTEAMIGFTSQANIAEITKLMQTYKMAIVDGPASDMYTVRFAMTGMPKEELGRVLKQLQDEKTVRFVYPKSGD